MLLIEQKTCLKCSVAQPATEFYRHRSMKGGRLNKCRTCTKADSETWRQKPANRSRWNEGRHRRKLLLQFGIAADAYDELYRDPKCGGCGANRSGDGKKLALDHNHKTGAVRGLLCHDCNRTIATANDDPSILRKLAAYLEESVNA